MYLNDIMLFILGRSELSLSNRPRFINIIYQNLTRIYDVQFCKSSFFSNEPTTLTFLLAYKKLTTYLTFIGFICDVLIVRHFFIR